MPADHRRAAVAAQLDALCGTGEVLDVDGPRSTRNLYADDATRRHTRARIIARYRDEQQHIACDRQFFAIATAGPPGAGKSTAIEAKGLAGRGWRVLDADRVKDRLIGEALDSGVYADLLGRVLADGHRLMPRELATLVHRESTAILDEITEQCLDLGENVVIEGTFGWPGLGERLLRRLGAADYRTLTIIDVEVPSSGRRSRRYAAGGAGGRPRSPAPTRGVAGSPAPPPSPRCIRTRRDTRCVRSMPGPPSTIRVPR